MILGKYSFLTYSLSWERMFLRSVTNSGSAAHSQTCRIYHITLYHIAFIMTDT